MESLVADLIECAEAEFRLDRPLKSGGTQRQRNITFEKAGKIAGDWRPPSPPAQLAHIWQWYLDLNRWRRVEVGRPAPLDVTAMAAWAQLSGHRPTPFCLDVFAALERTYFMVWNDTLEPSLDPDVAKKMKTGLRSMMDDRNSKRMAVKKNG